MFVGNLGAPWSSGAWGLGPNGPVVNPPLAVMRGHVRVCSLLILGDLRAYRIRRMLSAFILKNKIFLLVIVGKIKHCENFSTCNETILFIAR